MADITPDQITAGISAAEGAPDAPQEPAAPPAAAPTPPQDPKAQAAPTYPWDKDVAGLGFPPELLPKLNDYLSNSWQPRMTEFETKNKGYMDLFGGDENNMQIASQMFNAFSDDPENAFLHLGVEMGYLDPSELENYQPGSLGTPEEGDQGGQPQQSALPPEQQQWLDQKMQEEQKQAQMETLNKYFDGVGQEFGDKFDRDLYHMLFVGAYGNEDAALEKYRAYHGSLNQPDPTPPAPAVLNESTGTALSPAAEQPKNIDEAMAAWMEQQVAAKRAR